MGGGGGEWGGGVNALHETVGCHCSCGAGEAMSPLLKSRCTTLILLNIFDTLRFPHKIYDKSCYLGLKKTKKSHWESQQLHLE